MRLARVSLLLLLAAVVVISGCSHQAQAPATPPPATPAPATPAPATPAPATPVPVAPSAPKTAAAASPAAMTEKKATGATSSPLAPSLREGATVKIVKLDADPCIAWDPCEVRVKAGTTVTFVNNEVLAHDVTFIAGPEMPKSGSPGTLQPDQSWSHTFEKPGTYEFHCAVHHPLMHKPGVSPKVIVE